MTRMTRWFKLTRRVLLLAFKDDQGMQIHAKELLGLHHLQLAALEKYFTEAAALMAKQPDEAFPTQRRDLQNALEELRNFRLQFEALRHKHQASIELALAGHKEYITLNTLEVILLESIGEMYTNVWSNRRQRNPQPISAS